MPLDHPRQVNQLIDRAIPRSSHLYSQKRNNINSPNTSKETDEPPCNVVCATGSSQTVVSVDNMIVREYQIGTSS
jgi:hypothetical protein